VNSAVFITVVLGVIAGNVAMMGLVVKVLGDRIGDVAARLDHFETRADAKLDGLADTLARFDERLRHLE
jgi:hypothetical protein